MNTQTIHKVEFSGKRNGKNVYGVRNTHTESLIDTFYSKESAQNKADELNVQSTYTLSHLRETARRSYSWISQSPDRRGDSTIKDYSEELDADLKTITDMGADAEGIERYKKQYESKFVSWLHSQGNTASSFVTGGSNFPVRRQEKLHRWAENKYQDFRAWRTKVLEAYARYNKKAKIEAAGGELEIQKKNLVKLETLQQEFLKVNIAHRAYKKNPQSLQDSGLSEELQKLIIQWVPEYSYDKAPIQGYKLAGNRASIKRTKERIAELEARETAKVEGNKEIPFAGGVVVLNVEQDRLQIKHDVKPEQSVIDNFKKHGFRWSPFNKAWQRQLTDNAKIATSRILNITI